MGGYAKSKRSSSDGLVIFGTHDGGEQNQNELINVPCADFVIENGQHGFGKKHFAIYFEPFRNSFILVDLFQGSGTFVLLSEPTPMSKNKVVSFGTSHITFDPQTDNSIQARVIGGPLKGEIFMFKSE